jgi:hypothetical protein
MTSGVAYPSPTVTLHFFVSVSGHVAGMVKALVSPSRLCPRHWG